MSTTNSLTVADDLHARDPRRVRGHQQGPGDPPHAADVGRQLDPRHRPRRRDAHRRRGRQTRSASSSSLVAVAFATMNVVGGYVVTDRMLQMFRKKPVGAQGRRPTTRRPPS